MKQKKKTHITACQYVLRILTGNADLKLSEVKTQYTISKLVTHDVRLDVRATDESGTIYGMEIQGRDDVDHPRRVRIYTAMLDSDSLDKGFSYEWLPEMKLFYVCKKDFQKSGQTCWQVEKYQGDTKRIYNDGMHIIYVNAEIDDHTPIAELMKYFKTADPDNMEHGALSERIRYLKCEEGGQAIMCEVTDEFWQAGYASGELKRNKQIAQIVRNLAMTGMGVDAIAKIVSESRESVKQWLA